MRKQRLLTGSLPGCLLALVGISLSAGAQTTAPNEWTWMGGSSTRGEIGMYGILGTPASGNIPGMRVAASSWTDNSNHLWLFGGTGYDAIGKGGTLNDLWEFDLSNNEWTWMGGSSTVGNNGGQPGVYGRLETPAAGNAPGARNGAVSWTDSSGRFWLFGGEGYDAAGTKGILNDLWEFDPSKTEWTWRSGSSTIGGSCFQYDVGETNCAQSGVYGTLGTPAAANVPGSREGATSWTDSKGNLWLFGGWGYDIGQQLQYYFNDFWEFTPSTQEWVWMGGSSTGTGSACFQSSDLYYSSCGEPGVYGTSTTSSPGNMPGGRSSATGWTDRDGNLWLFGGSGFDANGRFSDLNDLWKFDSSTKEWAWMGGSSTVYDYYAAQTGVYGTLGTPAAGNIPATRWGAASWTDNKGNLWLFGGEQTGWYGNSGYSMLNDLWEFNPPTNEWAWMGGSDTGFPPSSGVYGTLGTPAAGNNPGDRYGSSSWTDSRGNFWLFGGYFFGEWTEGDTLLADDLWEYQPSAPVSIPAAATPAFSVPAGTYTTEQTVTISDATPGATIFYTTDKTTPTTSSPVYSSAITVSSTETLRAIATAGHDSPSATASATYTINLPIDFSVVASPSSLQLTAGQSGTTAVTVTPENGFNSAVSFNCSGLPFGTSCSFSPSIVTPSGGASSTTLTVTASAASATLRANASPYYAALAIALCYFGRRKRRSLLVLVLLAASMSSLGQLTGCGGGPSATEPKAVTSTVAITATSATFQHSTTLSLTLN